MLRIFVSTKSVSGLSSGKLEELKQLRRTQKRKSVNLTNEEDFFDKEFLEADKQILAKIRAEEFPSRTRTTVLSRRGCVSGSFVSIRSRSVKQSSTKCYQLLVSITYHYLNVFQ